VDEGFETLAVYAIAPGKIDLPEVGAAFAQLHYLQLIEIFGVGEVDDQQIFGCNGLQYALHRDVIGFGQSQFFYFLLLLQRLEQYAIIF